MRKIFIYLVLTILCLTIQAPFCIADTIPVQAQQTAPRTVTLNWAAGSGSVDVYRQYPGESQPSLHHQHFDFPDDLVPIGVKLFYEIARRG